VANPPLQVKNPQRQLRAERSWDLCLLYTGMGLLLSMAKTCPKNLESGIVQFPIQFHALGDFRHLLASHCPSAFSGHCGRFFGTYRIKRVPPVDGSRQRKPSILGFVTRMISGRVTSARRVQEGVGGLITPDRR